MRDVRRLAALLRVLAGCGGGRAASSSRVVLPPPGPASTPPQPVGECGRNVEVHDAAVEAAIRRALAKPSGPLGAAELGGIRRLAIASPVAVLDRCVFGALVDLRELYFHGGTWTDLGPLASLRSLTSLVLAGVPVTDLAPLRGLVAMQRLDISDTRVRDVGPLADMGALEELILSGSAVTDLSPLGVMRSLRYLDVSRTSITDTEMIPSPAMRVKK